MPFMIPGLIALGSAIAGWVGYRKVSDYLDPTDPGKFVGQERALARVFSRAEAGEGFTMGMDRIAASRAIQNIQASARIDFIRSKLEPAQLEATLKKIQEAEVAKVRENPDLLSYGDVFMQPFRVGSGISMSAFGAFTETPARALDATVSKIAGTTDTTGRHVARAIGLDDGGVAFNLVSGTLDFGKILTGDPLLIGGKMLKAARITRGATVSVDDLLKLGGKRATGKAGRIAPKAEKGKMVLYRGIPGAPEPGKPPGAWWTDDLDVAEQFAGPQGTVFYTKVPDEEWQGLIGGWNPQTGELVGAHKVKPQVLPVVQRQATEAEQLNAAMDYIFGLKRVRKWAEEMASRNSLSEVVRWARVSGIALDPDTVTAHAVTAARTAEGVTEALKVGFARGELDRAPLWPWLGKGKEAAWSVAARAPIVRTFQRAWNEEASPLHPEFWESMRRHMDFMFGDEAAVDALGASSLRRGMNLRDSDIAKMTDEFIERSQAEGITFPNKTAARDAMLSAEAKGYFGGMRASDWWLEHMANADGKDLVRLYEQMTQEGMTAWAMREFGKGYDEVTAAVTKLSRNKDISQTVFHNLGEMDPYGGKLPVLETQLRYLLHTYSYDDFWALAAQLSDVPVAGMTKRQIKKFHDRIDKMVAPMRTLWLSNPRYGMRIMMEESLGLLGDPRYGPLYRQALFSKMTGWMGRMPLAGSFIRKESGEVAKVRPSTAWEKYLRTMDAKARKEAISKNELPGFFHSANVLKSWARRRGAVPEDMARALKQDNMWQGMAWDYVGKANPNYLIAHAHVVNFQLLGDRMVRMLVKNWEDPVKRREVVARFMASAEGKDYLRGFSGWSRKMLDDLDKRAFDLEAFESGAEELFHGTGAKVKGTLGTKSAKGGQERVFFTEDAPFANLYAEKALPDMSDKLLGKSLEEKRAMVAAWMDEGYDVVVGKRGGISPEARAKTAGVTQYKRLASPDDLPENVADLRLVGGPNAPRVIREKVYGKTLDLTGGLDTFPPGLWKRLQAEGYTAADLDLGRYLEDNIADHSNALIDYAREHGFGKVKFGKQTDAVNAAGRPLLFEPKRVLVLPEFVGDKGLRAAKKRFIKEAVNLDSIADHVNFLEAMVAKNIPESLIADAKLGEVSEDAFKRGLLDLPDTTWGPVGLVHQTGKDAIKAQAWLFKKSGGFFNFIGQIVDDWGRRTGWHAAVEAEFDRLTKLSRARGVDIAPEDIAANARRLVGKRLVNLVDTKFNKTRADIMMRGFVPFIDAQVRFWKRWSRIATSNPGFIERTRLLLGVGEDWGWLEEDEHGNLVGKVPIASHLFEAIARPIVGKDVASEWFKVVYETRRAEIEGGFKGDFNTLGKGVLPAGVPFWGDVFPGFTPVLTMPVDWLTRDRPSFKSVRDAILGAGSMRAENIREDMDFPSFIVSHVQVGWMDKLWRAFNGSQNRDPQYLAAWADAMAMEAYQRSTDDKLYAPKPGAEMEEFVNAARAKARTMWIMRGLTQAFSPWSPTQFPFGGAQAQAWHDYRALYGPEEGVVKFMEDYGERAFAFTVGKSKQDDGASLAITKESEEFYEANREFFRDHAAVAGFFTRDFEGDFDFDFWRRRILTGEQQPLPPMDWWADVMYRLGNRRYYDEVRPQYEQMVLSGMDERQASAWLAQQREEVDEQYPGWERGYIEWSKRQGLRKMAQDEMRAALSHPAIAEGEAAKLISAFIEAYDRAMRQAHMSGLTSLRSKTMAPARVALARYARTLMPRSKVFEAAYSYLWQQEIEDEVI